MDQEAQHKAFQEQIEWCQSQRKWAAEMIEDFDKGVRWYRGTGDSQPQDVTEKWREHFDTIIKKMDRLISAYKKL